MKNFIRGNEIQLDHTTDSRVRFWNVVNKFVLVNYWILRLVIRFNFNAMNTIFLIGNGIRSGDIWYTLHPSLNIFLSLLKTCTNEMIRTESAQRIGNYSVTLHILLNTLDKVALIVVRENFPDAVQSLVKSVLGVAFRICILKSSRRRLFCQPNPIPEVRFSSARFARFARCTQSKGKR